jgi:hypothetical protein
MVMLTARSILSLRASITAAGCSVALPTMATMIRPTKSSVHPMVRVTGSMWLIKTWLATRGEGSGSD